MVIRHSTFRSLAFVGLVAAIAPAQAGQIGRTLNNSAAIVNNYSMITPGMPSYGIAQGSIVQIYGTGLTLATSPLQNVPLPTTLNGTTVNITINGTTTHAILYYVSPTQIDAIIPSATPVGTGQITVTVQGAGTGAPAPITVVQSAFGMLTLNGVGNGPAVAFDVNSNYLGLTNAANPGDFITLWGSGVGPVTGDETIAQTPMNLTNIPIEVDIGGKPSMIQYAGRSIYPGVDQINVQVPPGVSGCHTSVVVRSGDIVSNFGTIPVASGGRVCAEPDAGLTAGQIQTLMSQPVVNTGAVEFATSLPLTSGLAAVAAFKRFTNAQFAAVHPFTTVSFNDCTVYNYRDRSLGLGNPIQPVPLDAGPSISVSTPSGSGVGNLSIPFQNGAYTDTGLTSSGSLKGTYTFTAPGGADIGPFSVQIDSLGGGGFRFSTPNNPTSVTRSQGLLLTWNQPNNTDPSEFIQIYGFSFVFNYPFGAQFFCYVPLAAGQFTIPPAVLLALPVQPAGSTAQATLEVDLVISRPFTAPGADVSWANSVTATKEVFSYQ
jgi:uncharacterized protein (TIGR03437 family)